MPRYTLGTTALHDAHYASLAPFFDIWLVHVPTGDVDTLETHLATLNLEPADLRLDEDMSFTLRVSGEEGPHFTPVQSTIVVDDDSGRVVLTDESGRTLCEYAASTKYVTFRAGASFQSIYFNDVAPSVTVEDIRGDGDEGGDDEKLEKLKAFMLALRAAFSVWSN